jgi:hypothetical protein
MFAEVAQGKMSAEAAAKAMHSTVKDIFAKWKGQGLL